MITLHLLFTASNTVRDLAINETFLLLNNLPYSAITDITIHDVLTFLLANWQPQWGPKPASVSQIRFSQQGRALRFGLTLGELKLNSTFNIGMRPQSYKESNNRRASLLVPTSHHRTNNSINNSPGTRNSSSLSEMDVVNSDLSNYYNDRYGPNNRASYVRNSYYSTRQRYSYIDNSSNSLNRNYHRYSDTSEEEEDLMNHPEFGIINSHDNNQNEEITIPNIQPEKFHHVITTNKGKQELERKKIAAAAAVEEEQKEIEEELPNENSNNTSKQTVKTNRNSSYNNSRNIQDNNNGGGCCVII